MLDRDTRSAVLHLAHQGHSIRAIARILGLSRNSVKRVLQSRSVEVPPLERANTLSLHLDRIRQLHQICKGNRVRVAEMLADEGISVAYSTLTHFCRRHGIGVRLPRRSGHYHFDPGEEMQHDTSPHTVTVGGKRRPLHCASLVLCYSRRIFAQAYPRWRRFEVKIFLTEALQHFGGSARRCMIDNSSVVIAHGSGDDAVVAREMEAFSARFGFHFRAHALGDANRSARVERPFHYIENNFYVGRRFESLADLNEQMRAWCDQVDDRPKRVLGRRRPLELFGAESAALVALPPYIPEVYEPHQRRVDVDAYVSFHANRYSVPAELIGRRVEVRETADKIRIFDGPRWITEHELKEPGLGLRISKPEHHQRRRSKRAPAPPSPQETTLRKIAPELAPFIEALRHRHGGQAARSIRQLHRMALDYPLEVLVGVVEVALGHGLLDLSRIERMVLRRLAGEFFRLPLSDDEPLLPGDTEKDTDHE